MRGLQGQVAVVTGAASGIGKALSLGLARAGCMVCLVDIGHLGGVHDEILGFGGRACTVTCDVSSESDVTQLFETVLNEFGRVDIVANIAGIYPTHTVETMSFADWDRVLSVNLRSVYLTSHAVVPLMKRQNYGRILSVTSGLATNGAAGGAHYSASKAGIVGFTKSLAREVGDWDINVNAIAPGITDTPLLRRANSDEQVAAMEQGLIRKRIGHPEDVVGPALFLFSEAARMITGQVLWLR